MKKNMSRPLTSNTKLALGMLVFAIINAVLLFSSRGASWEAWAPLCFMFLLIGLSGAFAIAMDPAHPKREPIPVRIVNARPARRRR